MSIANLDRNSKKVVGIKQVSKAVQRGEAQLVFIAADAEQGLLDSLKELCATQGVPIQIVEKKQELGRACGIQTSAAAVALLKP